MYNRLPLSQGGFQRRGSNLPPPIPWFLPFPPPFCVLASTSLRIFDCKILCNVVCFPISPLPATLGIFLPRLLLPSVNLPPPCPPLHLKHAIGVREPKPVQDNGSLRCPIVNKRATSIPGNKLYFEAAGV